MRTPVSDEALAVKDDGFHWHAARLVRYSDGTTEIWKMLDHESMPVNWADEALAKQVADDWVRLLPLPLLLEIRDHLGTTSVNIVDLPY